MARELAPAGLRSSPRLLKQRTGAASRPSGSLLPRHRCGFHSQLTGITRKRGWCCRVNRSRKPS
ncbi:hypothetical protein DYL61_27455 [Pseudomonas nabeulensis]|uniref:Uncharacterized protein n=1 Tax=Pseudomonas nabeulensis TaxID=2293833 RepID=A0A4Z0AK58_9PSED|nr:hypothetical protein DYL61_27455 [Pseudomonas nabeulensis]